MSKANRIQGKKIAGDPISAAAVKARVGTSQQGTRTSKGADASKVSATFVSARPVPASSMVGLLADLTDSSDLSEESIRYRHPRRG